MASLVILDVLDSHQKLISATTNHVHISAHGQHGADAIKLAVEDLTREFDFASITLMD